MYEQSLSLDHKGQKLDVSYAEVKRGGTTVICLHGLQSNKDMFAPMQDLFERKKFSTIAIDFIGFGKSSKPQDFSYDLEDQAAVIDKVFEHLRLQKFCILGHSMGGMVGTMLLKSWRASILEFVNMEGNFVLEDCGASLEGSEKSFEEFSQKWYPEFLTSLETSAEPGAKDRRKWLRTTPDYVFYKTSKSIVDWSRSGKLLPMFTESPVSKSFFYGENNAGKKEVLPASIPTAKIPNAGHFMFADNPEATLRAIDDFLL